MKRRSMVMVGLIGLVSLTVPVLLPEPAVASVHLGSQCFYETNRAP